MEATQELHLRKAERARECMKLDSQSTDAETYVMTMDLQKALPFPVLTVSDAYYKRNLYVYNFGIHDMKKKCGYFYCWDETIASRSSVEVASSLLVHFKQAVMCCNPVIKHIVIYSDCCTGQNRNLNIALTLLRFVSEDNSIETIEQKFLVSGHSYLPNDGDFGCVETASKNRTIYGPKDWYNIMKDARRTNKFVIHEMQTSDFVAVTGLQDYVTKRKKNVAGIEVNWLKMRHIKYDKRHRMSIFYKETLNDLVGFQELNLKKNRTGSMAGRPSLNLIKHQLKISYPFGRPVTASKKKDMEDLLQFIPPIHHPFFMGLRTTETPEEVVPQN